MGRQRSAEPAALRVAKALLHKGDHTAALRQFEQAVREHPNHPLVLLEAAHAFGRRYRLDRAEALLEKAHRLAPRRPDIQYLVGEGYRLIGRLPQAQAAFERACRLVDQFPDAQWKLAFLYERRHRLEEALELVDRVLVAQPQHPQARLLKARILRRQDDSQRCEAILQQLLRHSSLRPAIRAEAFGELSQLYDALQQYEQAWTAILAAKKILLQIDSKPWAAAQIVFGRFGQLARDVSSEQLRQWMRPVASEPARVAMLTGFPRSGTTLLEQILESHEDLVSCEEQDVLSAEIFPNLAPVKSHETPVADVLQQLSPDGIAEARERYLRYIQSLLGESVGSRLLLDKNPAMTLMVPVVLRLFPEMKLLVSLRDPRDVIVSCFLRYLPLNPVSVCFLTLDRLADRYLLDLNAWQRYRALLEGGWFEVRYEHLVGDTEKQMKHVLDFLGLAGDASRLDHRSHALKNPVNSPTYEDVAKPIYASAIGRWKHYQQQLEPILPRFEAICRDLGYE